MRIGVSVCMMWAARVCASLPSNFSCFALFLLCKRHKILVVHVKNTNTLKWFNSRRLLRCTASKRVHYVFRCEVTTFPRPKKNANEPKEPWKVFIHWGKPNWAPCILYTLSRASSLSQSLSLSWQCCQPHGEKPANANKPKYKKIQE